MPLSPKVIQYGKVFGDWTIQKEIGKGSGGETKVYQIIRRDTSLEEICAVKAIPIISEIGKYDSLPDRRKEEYRNALSDRTKRALDEVRTMMQVGGHTNTVTYHDRQMAKWTLENEFGCDLLIRMEFLHNLRDKIKEGHISEEETIRIGRDICTALILCHKNEIIHRDIKPENIFFNDNKDYKLGDFGISRIIDKCSGVYATTSVGTAAYIAPEQLSSRYDERADIYSLGLVLYELRNRNRLPFASSSYYLNDEDVKKRLRAKILPEPCDASPELKNLILTACAHEPEGRYQSAQDMLDALNQLGSTEPKKPVKSEPSAGPDPTGDGGSGSILSDFLTEKALPDLSDDPGQQAAVPELIRELLKKANEGDVEAQNALGRCYGDGDDVAVDYKEAIKWFQKAANQGYAKAMYNLGNCYYNGEGVEQDYSLAAEWFQKAANRGHDKAMYWLGRCYYCGLGVVKSYSLAVKWFQKAANQGIAKAMYYLGFCYHNEQGVEKDDSLAVEWFRKAADMGNAAAMNELGDCYYYGRGVEKDYSVAAEWYQKASNKGSTEAMDSLGDCYHYGYGVEKDGSLAVKWYQKAADKGSLEAMVGLGWCYYIGEGVEQDYSPAVEWFQKAADRGNVTAMYILGRLNCDELGIKPNYSLAAEWFQKAADKGWNADEITHWLGCCYFNLGKSYYDGLGMEPNYSLAVEWFRKAADMGNADAMYWLGRCYFNGKGVEKNYYISFEWYQKAADEGSDDARYLLGYNYY